MAFIIKQRIEELLKEVITNNDLIDRHRKIVELKTVLKIIECFEGSSEGFKGVRSVHRLPVSKTGYSEYRLIDDCDSDDRSYWVEIENLRLSEGDLIIEMKD